MKPNAFHVKIGRFLTLLPCHSIDRASRGTGCLFFSCNAWSGNHLLLDRKVWTFRVLSKCWQTLQWTHQSICSVTRIWHPWGHPALSNTVRCGNQSLSPHLVLCTGTECFKELIVVCRSGLYVHSLSEYIEIWSSYMSSYMLYQICGILYPTSPNLQAQSIRSTHLPATLSLDHCI